jgi:hypothetical protein
MKENRLSINLDMCFMMAASAFLINDPCATPFSVRATDNWIADHPENGSAKVMKMFSKYRRFPTAFIAPCNIPRIHLPQEQLLGCVQNILITFATISAIAVAAIGRIRLYRHVSGKTREKTLSRVIRTRCGKARLRSDIRLTLANITFAR